MVRRLTAEQDVPRSAARSGRSSAASCLRVRYELPSAPSDRRPPGCPRADHHASWRRRLTTQGMSHRGAEGFVPVSWDQAFDLIRDALLEAREEFGNESIYGGSYGWASAGRLHHAQTALKRFLLLFGGYRTLTQRSTLQGGGVGHPRPGGSEGRRAMALSPCPTTQLSDLPPDGREVRPVEVW